ncbi:MAG TPA: DNA polymerase III subunit delta [Oleiagrimonas sp.]|nr:DNA polymerase III subunit delta [Oleiagrimonas sp.]
MTIRADQWYKQLKGDRLAPVQLLAGEELLVLEAADALRARARELGYDEREVINVEARFDWDDLARAAAGMSLFATRRLLDLRLPGGRPGKEGGAAITAYCKDPPPDTLLLITCNEWSNKHGGAWSRAVEKAGALVVFWPPKMHEWPKWIAARLASRGIQASPEAVTLLAERVEGNLLAAAQEVDKLVAVHGQGRLDAATLEALVADASRYDVFKLTDAAFGGDAARAVRIVEGLRAEGDELVPLMGWIDKQLEQALRLAQARDFAAQARADHLWQARESLFRAALRRAPRGFWPHCLARAARIDRMIKGREQGDPWRELERLVAAIADPRMARALA